MRGLRRDIFHERLHLDVPTSPPTPETLQFSRHSERRNLSFNFEEQKEEKLEDVLDNFYPILQSRIA